MARPDTNWPMPTNTGTGESANNPSLRNVTGENRGAADPWPAMQGSATDFGRRTKLPAEPRQPLHRLLGQ